MWRRDDPPTMSTATKLVLASVGIAGVLALATVANHALA